MLNIKLEAFELTPTTKTWQHRDFSKKMGSKSVGLLSGSKVKLTQPTRR